MEAILIITLFVAAFLLWRKILSLYPALFVPDGA